MTGEVLATLDWPIFVPLAAAGIAVIGTVWSVGSRGRGRRAAILADLEILNALPQPSAGRELLLPQIEDQVRRHVVKLTVKARKRYFAGITAVGVIGIAVVVILGILQNDGHLVPPGSEWNAPMLLTTLVLILGGTSLTSVGLYNLSSIRSETRALNKNDPK